MATYDDAGLDYDEAINYLARPIPDYDEGYTYDAPILLYDGASNLPPGGSATFELTATAAGTNTRSAGSSLEVLVRAEPDAAGTKFIFPTGPGEVDLAVAVAVTGERDNADSAALEIAPVVTLSGHSGRFSSRTERTYSGAGTYSNPFGFYTAGTLPTRESVGLVLLGDGGSERAGSSSAAALLTVIAVGERNSEIGFVDIDDVPTAGLVVGDELA